MGVINTNFNNSQTFEAAWNDLTASAPQGTIVDETPPTVDAPAAPDITAATGADQNVTLTLSDDTALDVSELDPGDISVTGPNGSDLSVTSAAVNEDSDGTPRSVTCGVAAPGGDWDVADNGTYTVTITNEADGGQQIETVTLNIDASLLPCSMRP